MPGNIIVTGANGNLGTATVKKFLDEGYKVIAVDHQDTHLQFAVGNVAFERHAIDLSDEKATREFAEKVIQSHTRIDGVLMLAGGFAMGDIAHTDTEALHKMIALNFETVYSLARPLLSHMVDNGYGRIVLIGARPALVAEQGKNAIAYALSKSLLFQFAELINAETKGKNVTASVVVPSTIDTSANRQSMPDADPSNWVKPERIADVLEFICSEKGSALRETVIKIYNNA